VVRGENGGKEEEGGIYEEEGGYEEREEEIGGAWCKYERLDWKLDGIRLLLLLLLSSLIINLLPSFSNCWGVILQTKLFLSLLLLLTPKVLILYVLLLTLS
jgi:hypothetical protein